MLIENKTFILNNTDLVNGFKLLKKKISERNKELLKNQYFYINIWNLACNSCVEEIPILETLPLKLNKQIGCLMVSAHSEKAVDVFMRRKNVIINNFCLLNEMIDFISGVYNEISVKQQSFPMHLILDKKGNCLAYLFGAFHDENSAAPLINFINSLD